MRSTFRRRERERSYERALKFWNETTTPLPKQSMIYSRQVQDSRIPWLSIYIRGDLAFTMVSIKKLHNGEPEVVVKILTCGHWVGEQNLKAF